VFHDHNDDGRQQSGHFELTQDRDGLTVLRDDLEMTTRLFLQLSIYTGEEFMVPYILVGMFGMFVASETWKLRRAILRGAERLSAVNVGYPR
jgi:hypothetical protein